MHTTTTAPKIGHEGTCPACFKTQSVAPGGETMVLHGFTRPGDGETHGQCFGYRLRAFEISAEGSVAFVVYLQTQLDRQVALLAHLQGGSFETLQVNDYKRPIKYAGTTIGYEKMPVARGTREFQVELENQLHECEREIRWYRRDIASIQARIDMRKSAPLRAYDIEQREREAKAAVIARKDAKKAKWATEGNYRRIKDFFDEICRSVRWHSEESEESARRRQTLRPGEIGTFVDVYGKTAAQFAKARKAAARTP